MSTLQRYLDNLELDDFYREALAEGWLSPDGEILSAEYHVALLQEAVHLLDAGEPFEGDDDERDQFRKDLLSLEQWWTVQGMRMFAGEHYVTEVYHEPAR